jgi:DnaJ family protein C protein 2
VEAKLAEGRRLVEEKEVKAQEKVQREKEKKMLRKTKQAFKKIVAEMLSSLQKREHELEDEVDFICSQLDREQLLKLNSNLESKASPDEVFQIVKRRANNLHEIKDDDDAKEAEEAQNKKNERESAPSAPAKLPFSKEELNSLGKGIKKYPPGGANRWDQIATYINNVCRPETPKTKEECIATFNKINKEAKPAAGGSGVGNTNGTIAKPVANGNATTADNNSDEWTEEQDKLLQDGLVKFPAGMEKNERWMNIAKCVPGKSKKDCVQRFKAIRDAIKSK